MKMRDAAKKGLNFYQWLKTQEPKPHKSELKTLQLRFESIEDFYQHPMNPDKPKRKDTKDYMCIDQQGWPHKSERKTFKVFTTEREASLHGKEVFGYRNFTVTTLGHFNKTRPARVIAIQHKILSRMHEYIPTVNTKNKATGPKR